MKAIAIATLGLLASPAMAGQCRLLIKQLNDAAGKMRADDARVKQGKAPIAEAPNLHDGSKHAASVKKCDEADKVLGVELGKKM